MRENKVVYGLIGYGGMGRWHTEILSNVSEAVIGGIYDIKEEKREEAKEKGFFVYETEEAMLADPDIDVVLIATPNDCHKPIAIRAMHAGKNVISEKPVTLSSTDLLEMENAAKETGKLLTVHQNRRWDDDFLIIKKLVEDGVVDGWDDPRLVSIAAFRRRGFTPESIKKFVDLCGVSKANSSVDYAMLEYCIREDLKLKKARTMAVLNPVKLVIDNYPEDQIEMLKVQNNLENPELGSRQVPFGRELYIEREDFMEEPVRKYFRMFPGNEVRLMNAYFVTCTGCEKDENGNITVIHGTYDPESKGGNSPDGRKVKGTIHWVAAKTAVKAECRLYENLIDEEKGVYNEDGSMNLNPNSLTVLKECYLEPSLKDAKAYDSFQFVRNGFFCVDAKDSKEDALVFNRIVSLKSSFKLPAAK